MAKKIDMTNAAAVLGSKGGRNSAAKLTAKERSERGKKAIQARWAKKEAADKGK